MAARILLITPDPGFGELIDQILVEDGGYEVDLVTGGMDALAAAQEAQFILAILDCAVTDISVAELAGTLRDWQPAMRWIVVPPDNDPADPALESVRPDAHLTKPFYQPDLLKLVAGVLGESAPQPDPSDDLDPPDSPDHYPWLEDVNRAAQYLARLSMETSAVAALITRGEQLWAFAGELGQPGGESLAETVGRQWGSQSGKDLARFVTLENGREYMLYATALVDELVLALIFDARTPFSKIRVQSTQVARALSADPEQQAMEDRAEELPAVAGDGDSTADPPGSTESDSPGRIKPPGVHDLPLPQSEPAAAHAENPSETRSRADLDLLEAGGLALDNAFDDSVYSTNVAEPPDRLPEVDPELELLDAMDRDDLLLQWLPNSAGGTADLLVEVEETLEPFSIPSDWAPNRDRTERARSFLEELLEEPLPVGGSADLDPSTAAQAGRPLYPPPEAMAETRPTRVPPEESGQDLEPGANAYTDITYACVLIPRMLEHLLVSEVGEKLEEWMFQLCVSFDWRLEQLTIRPEYMQWLVHVHAATAPRSLMQITSRITSQRIFEDFPNYRDENPTGEFWAPGWLVITSEHLPPPAMVNEFIRKTRERQGV